jgi:hypothetical protein
LDSQCPWTEEGAAPDSSVSDDSSVASFREKSLSRFSHSDSFIFVNYRIYRRDMSSSSQLQQPRGIGIHVLCVAAEATTTTPDSPWRLIGLRGQTDKNPDVIVSITATSAVAVTKTNSPFVYCEESLRFVKSSQRGLKHSILPSSLPPCCRAKHRKCEAFEITK